MMVTALVVLVGAIGVVFLELWLNPIHSTGDEKDLDATADAHTNGEGVA